MAPLLRVPGLLPGESLPPLLTLSVPRVPVPDRVPATLVVPLKVAGPVTFKKPPLLIVAPPVTTGRDGVACSVHSQTAGG